MTERFKAWWALRTTREQRLLLVMFALLAVVIVWLGVIRPVTDALASARERHATAITRLAEIRAAAEAYRELRRSAPPSLAAPLATVVAQSAAEAGFQPTAITPDGAGRVTVSLASARPIALFSWVAQLEAQGIMVERMTAKSNSDPTLGVELVLRGRAA